MKHVTSATPSAQTPDLPVQHYYFDVLASHPGKEIIEIQDRNITVLDENGKILEAATQ